MTLFAGVVAGCGSGGPDPVSDCDFPDSEIDHLVCEDDELNALHGRFVDTQDRALEAGTPEQTFAPDQFAHDVLAARDDCAAADRRACIIDAYLRGIAELETRFGLVEPAGQGTFRCDDGADIVATFYATDAPVARLERDGTVAIGWQVRAASGARYETSDGIVFWARADEAMVEWPAGTSLRCRIEE